MKCTCCSYCGGYIPEGTRAYVGIHSGRGEVFCSKDCIIRYLTSGQSVYVDSQADGQLNWFDTKDKQNVTENK